MIDVATAEKILFARTGDFGAESVDLLAANGRVLAEDIAADRDYPPYDRVMMDGFALAYADFASGQPEFAIQTIQAAGVPPEVLAPGKCIQVMTGAVLPEGADTIIPVEEIEQAQGSIRINAKKVEQGQFIHQRSADTKAGDMLVPAGTVLTAVSIPLAAAAGKSNLMVRKLPRTVMITTGDELVDVDQQPTDYQIRQSNNFAVAAALDKYGIQLDMRHTTDDVGSIKQVLADGLENYDLVIISGGVSKGEYDYVPGVLADLSAEVLFHGVAQKPGKPLLLAATSSATAFAFPGNPVSTMLCLHKYLLPWLRASMGASPLPASYAVLDSELRSPAGLQHFAQVRLKSTDDGLLHAAPIKHNGSGDFSSLIGADAFMEIPASQTTCQPGEVYKVIML